MKKAGSKTMLKIGAAALGFVVAGTAVGATNFSAFAAKKDGDAFVGETYLTETSSAEDSLDKAKAFNEKIAEEGFTLLKNDGAALPLAATSGKIKVNLLGKNWVNPAYGGSGSSSFDANSGAGIDVLSAMKEAGFEYNEDLVSFYKDNKLSGAGRPSYSYGTSDMETGETPVSAYSEALKASFENYTAANVVMVSRVGGEGYDVTSSYTKGKEIAGRKNAEKEHYLMLDDNEKDLLKLAKESGGKKVILVINAAQPLELSDADMALVDAILWVGLPGSTGFAALPRILNGEVNPSGRTVDTYAKNFFTIPAYFDFSNNGDLERDLDNAPSGSESCAPIISKGNGVYAADGTLSGATGVNTYSEGIYVGYRYFETRAFTEDAKTGATANKWYEDNVRFPFGYGLSYTTFEYSKVEYKTTALTKDGTVDVEVTVKNTGEKAGKEVVEFYYSAPYTDGGIEKSHVVLGDFAKTKLLQAGESDTVTLSIKVKDMASYDFDDLNDNGYKCYEVEKGNYTFYVGNNSHAWYNAAAANKTTINLAEGFTYEMDIDGKHDKNDNQFDDVSAGLKGEGISVLSRADFEGTMPAHPTKEARTADAATIAKLTTYGVYTKEDPDGSEYDKDQAWYVETMPTQAEKPMAGNEKDIIKLTDMKDVAYDNARWDQFLNQFTKEQLAAFVNTGFFTTLGLDAFNLPESKTPDGPFGFVGQAVGYSGNRCYYVSPCIVAATFNKEIAEQQGKSIGEEGIWMGYNGIYAPGANIHRTPWSGRNFEYYSEDATLSAVMCKNVVNGMQSKGVMPFIKHFALNDQETDRNGVATYANEQTMREIYLRSFQWSVEDGAMGIMSSFNRVGTTWAGASYPLLTNVLRKEWGFKGIVITDWANGGYMNLDQMVRAGNDLSLGQPAQHSVTMTAEAQTPTHIAALRQAAKNICYTVLRTSEMSKLTEYEELLGLSKVVLAATPGTNYTETINFASKTFEEKYEKEGYTVTYEITKPDSKVQDPNSTSFKEIPCDPALPEGYATIDAATGVVTVNTIATIEEEQVELKNGTYQLCVSIKVTKEGVSNYLGQSATVLIEKTTMTAVVAELEGKIEALEAQVAELNKAIAGYQTQIDANKTAIETLNTTITALQGKVTALETSSGANATEIASLKTTIQTLQTTVTTLETTTATLNTALTEAQGKITALETAKTADEAKIAALETKVAELENKVGALETKTEELSKSGCGSSIGIGAISVAGVLALASVAFVLRKKREN